jgi:hypothetical protein
VLRKPGEEQNIAQVETVSLDDLRYSYYGSLPPGAHPAMASAGPTSALLPPPPERKAQIARISRPRSTPVVSKAVVAVNPMSTIAVTRGTETKDYEVGGYAQ